MTMLQAAASLSRRRALKLGAGLAGGLAAVNTFGNNFTSAQDAVTATTTAPTTLPNSNTQTMIETALDAKGMAVGITRHQVLAFNIVRSDLSDLSYMGVTIPASFAFVGQLYFQTAPASKTGNDYDVIVNGDVCVKATELDKFLYSLVLAGITVQAVRQLISPDVWFVHFRNVGNPTSLAKGIKTALDLTATRFPQDTTTETKTSLNSTELGATLGATPQIGADGAITFNIPRGEAITLDGIPITDYLNASKVSFLPLNGSGNAGVLADIAALSTEVNHVLGSVLKAGWTPIAVFNHETDESPQLTFVECLKWGNAITLAQEVRAALRLTNVYLI